jgi:hypothetical protein
LSNYITNRVCFITFLITFENRRLTMSDTKKTFRDYLGPEDLLQESCLRLCARKLVGVPIIHVPNEGKRSSFERFKFKVLGGEEGISDLFIPMGSGDHKGLWVELKCKRNKLTPEQLQFLAKMHYMGYAVAVVWDKVEDFELLLDSYQNDPLFFKGGIVVAKGDLSSWKYADAEKKLVKHKSASTVKREASKSFEKKAKAKFGTAIKSSALPNAGKLFKSPLNKN